MTRPNSTNLELTGLDNSYPIDIVKPLVTNSKLMPSASSFSTLHLPKTSKSGHIPQRLHNVSNYSEPNSTLNRDKSHSIHSKKLHNPEKHTFSGKHQKNLGKIEPEKRSLKIDEPLKESVINPNIMSSNQKASESTNISSISLNKTGSYKEGSISVLETPENKSLNSKRDFEPEGITDITRKKVHAENENSSIQIGDDDESFDFIRILDDETGMFENSQEQNNKNEPEIKENSNNGNTIRIPISINSEITIENKEVNKGITFGNAENSATAATTAGKPKDKAHQSIVNTDINEEADSGMDLFGLDGFGIKILDEIFLCTQCHKELSQEDLDRGFKDVCWKCQSKEALQFNKTSENKAQLSETMPESESDFFSNSQAFPFRVIPNEKTTSLDEEFNTYFRNEIRFEKDAKEQEAHGALQGGSDTWYDIMEPQYNIRLYGVGHKYQAEITPMSLYKKERREIKRLWNPSKMDDDTFERFRVDVNGKNAVILMDEEIAEILVRNEYDAMKALQWSVKSNPEFQFYFKRSSNRRRTITKMGTRYN